MRRIVVYDLVGESALTYEAGEKIFERIYAPLMQGESMELDFSRVELFSPPFFCASIGRLLTDIPTDLAAVALQIVHISGAGDGLLRSVIDDARACFVTTPDHRAAIDRIVASSNGVLSSSNSVVGDERSITH